VLQSRYERCLVSYVFKKKREHILVKHALLRFNSYIFSTDAYGKSRGLSNRTSACSTVICISDGLSAPRAAAFVAACSAMTLCLSFSPSECNLPTYIFHGYRYSFVCVNFERHLICKCVNFERHSNFNMIMLTITMQFP